MLPRSARTFALMLLALGPLWSVPGAAAPLVYGNAAGWTVWTDPDVEFRCYAVAEYEGGTRIRAGYDNPDGALEISFSDAAWTAIVGGREYTLNIQIDDGPITSFDGTGLAAGRGISFIVPGQRRQTFVAAFVGGYSANVSPAGLEPVMLSLGGSYAAMQMLDECQDSMAEYRQ